MVDSVLDDWEELQKEYAVLDEEHRVYSSKVKEVKDIQKKCISQIGHQRYRVKQIIESMKRIEEPTTDEDKEKLKQLKKNIEERKSQFRELEEVLPHENGVYLKVILGSVNVSLLSKNDKFKYKEDYERFKLYVTIISVLLALTIWLVIQSRVTDAVFQFLLVWYYCTLTIREHILVVNGSRIKGWWISHHFIATACAGILLIWPEGYTYHEFRIRCVLFSLYISLVQLLQYYYQSGCLYRLRALGERHNMDITVEGFQSWMWKGLTFLLPALVGGYVFQLYNAYVLFKLSFHPQCSEWQVMASAVIFFVLACGNLWTTFGVIKSKITKSGWMKNLEFVAHNKYRFNNSKNH